MPSAICVDENGVEMTDLSQFSELIRAWWEAFPPRSRSRGNIAGGLVLIENLRDNLRFDIDEHKASGSDQLKSASRRNVQRILERFGENRILLKEGGRTNRGLMRNLTPLLEALSETDIRRMSDEDRSAAFDGMQAFLAERARDVFNAEKISFSYSQDIASREIVGKILDAAYERGKAGEVAEYLVGAKLALRFPNYAIRNSAASAADDQTAEQGDFQINDCVFHVSVSPNSGHYDKRARNLSDGFRTFLLVPDRILAGARQNADLQANGRISVEAIESFVSQNIEELSDFAGSRVSENIKLLIHMYNERIAEVETDLSLQIRIPAALER